MINEHVSWEENSGAAENRKAEGYKNFIEKCEDEGLETELRLDQEASEIKGSVI